MKDAGKLESEILDKFEHKECGPVEIISELKSKVPYTRLFAPPSDNDVSLNEPAFPGSSSPGKSVPKRKKSKINPLISINYTINVAKEEKIVDKIREDIAKDLNDRIIKQLHKFYAEKIMNLEATINYLETGIETKKEMDLLKKTFMAREEQLEKEINICKQTIANKEEIIGVLQSMGTADTSIFSNVIINSTLWRSQFSV